MPGRPPRDPRAGDQTRVRRALAAVAVSLAVAVAVAAPAAIRVTDSDAGERGPAATTTSAVQSTTTAPSTVPVEILGTTTVREGP